MHVHADHFSKIAGDSREFGASSVERDEDAVVVRQRSKVWARRKEEILEAGGESEGDLRDCVPTGDVRRDVVVADGCREDADARFGIVPRATGTRSKMREERDAKLNRPDGSSMAPANSGASRIFVPNHVDCARKGRRARETVRGRAKSAQKSHAATVERERGVRKLAFDY